MNGVSFRPRNGRRPAEPAERRCVSCCMKEVVDGFYFAGREVDERALSFDAPDERAAAAHAEMAERYEALAAIFGAKRLADPPGDYL